jgi:hypothetical protein
MVPGARRWTWAQVSHWGGTHGGAADVQDGAEGEPMDLLTLTVSGASGALVLQCEAEDAFAVLAVLDETAARAQGLPGAAAGDGGAGGRRRRPVAASLAEPGGRGAPRVMI